MRQPTPKGNKSNWLLFKAHDFPTGVSFHLKLDQRTAELGFNGMTVDQILRLKSEWPESIAVVQKGKTASLVIQVPELDRLMPLDEQVEALVENMRAIELLRPYGRMFVGEQQRTIA
jgi:hypothetical protein